MQVERIPYVVDNALGVMKAAGNLVLVGAREPVAFFAYPDKPSLLMPEGRHVDQARRPRGRHAARRSKRSPIELGALKTPPAQNRSPAPSGAPHRRHHARLDRGDPRRS